MTDNIYHNQLFLGGKHWIHKPESISHTRRGETQGPTRPSLALLRFCFGWCQVSYHARTIPPDAQKMHTSRMKCLGEIIQVPTTQESWLNTQVSIKTGGFGIKELALHSPATARLPFATAYGTPSARDHFRHTIHDKVAWHPGSTTHTIRATCPTCATRTLWTP